MGYSNSARRFKPYGLLIVSEIERIKDWVHYSHEETQDRDGWEQSLAALVAYTEDVWGFLKLRELEHILELLDVFVDVSREDGNVKVTLSSISAGQFGCPAVTTIAKEAAWSFKEDHPAVDREGEDFE